MNENQKLDEINLRLSKERICNSCMFFYTCNIKHKSAPNCKKIFDLFQKYFKKSSKEIKNTTSYSPSHKRKYERDKNGI